MTRTVSRPASVSRKLLVHAALATGIALLLAGVVAIYLHHRSGRAQMERDLSIRTDIVAGNVTAALTFEDRDEAAEVLGSLVVDENVRAACVYDDETLFAEYRRTGNTDPMPVRPLAPGARFEGSGLTMSKPIVLDGERIGWIYVSYDMAELYRDMRAQLLAGSAILVLAMLVAVLLAARLQRAVTRPIHDLAETARDVSKNRDYSVRARRQGAGEIGQLTDAFNDMLTQIQIRDAELRRTQDELEQRVRARTSQLQAATRAAEVASEVKTEFLANMSHEIRTPMSAVLGYADLLLDPELDASERLNAIQTMRRNGEHLLEILNDILDLSKIEAGRMTVEQIPCSPGRVVVEVASLMRARAGEKGLELDVEFPGSLPKTIRSDPTRLRQILINLVGNAIKFTREGSVRVVTTLAEQRPADPPRLRIDVIDTGVGLSEGQVQGLFRAFSQADTTTTREFGGTGLGLIISKRLADQLGGDLVVHSAPEQGSTFSLFVETGPLEGVTIYDRVSEAGILEEEALELPTVVDRAQAQLEGLHVLLAEDGPENQLLISLFLKKAGADVELAANGRIACDKALEAWGSGTPYDVILMDMQMPELDGYGATSRLRRKGYTGRIIALTAHAMPEDRAKCLAAGCDEYTPKPIDRAKLLALVAEHGARDGQQSRG